VKILQKVFLGGYFSWLTL